MNLALVVPILLGSLAVTWFARWRGWPAPLLITLVAMAVSFIPAMPQIDIDGELVLWVVLPPLLYSASLDASFLSFRESIGPIRRLGIGLVLATTGAVAVVAMIVVPQFGWVGALLLGAIVSPPDAVSAAAIGRRLGLPRRVMAVISGESLVNDATALTLYRVFVAAVAGTTVSWLHGFGDFAWAVLSGVALGLLIGVIVHQIRMRSNDSTLVTTMGLLVPFVAYAAGEFVHGSGVLVVVFAGLYVGLHAPQTRYTTRQQERPLWNSLDTLLEGAVFALIGLQVTHVVSSISADPDLARRTILLASLVLLTVLLLRPIWVFSVHWLVRASSRLRSRLRHPRHEPEYSWRELTVISWTGMRGVVTLATAAALPSTDAVLGNGSGEIIFTTAFVVTIGTLLIQGLTLAPLIRRLNVADPGEAERDAEQVRAVRERAANEGLAYLERMRPVWTERFGESETERVFGRLAAQIERSERKLDQLGEDSAREQGVADRAARNQHLQQLTRDWLEIRRNVLLEELRAGNLSEEVMREMITSMDAEELALDTITGSQLGRQGR